MEKRPLHKRKKNSRTMIQIESSDILRLILQHLKECGLTKSVQQLQSESGIYLNVLENKDKLIGYIHEGMWDMVLEIILSLSDTAQALPMDSLTDLYEQIFLELVEIREIGVARNLLRQTEPLSRCKELYPQRYALWEGLLVKPSVDELELYGESVDGKMKKRFKLSAEISKNLISLAPGRLLSLIGQAIKDPSISKPPDCNKDVASLLKYNPLKNVFELAIQSIDSDEDLVPTQPYTSIQFDGDSSYAEVVSFSPDGRYFVTGSSDGFIEVWSEITGKLRRDLDYQAQERFMTMDESVVCMAFSKDSELLATGSVKGCIRVWKLETGQCVCKFPGGDQPVLSLSFAVSSSHILSAHYDGILRIYGQTSQRMLHQFPVHEGTPASSCHYDLKNRLKDGTEKWIVSSSLSGEIIVSGVKSGSQHQSLQIKSPSAKENSESGTILSLLPIPFRESGSSIYIAVSPPRYLHVIAPMQGKVLKTICLPMECEGLVSACFSCHGKYLYALDDSGIIYTVLMENMMVLDKNSTIHLSSGSEWISLAHHPMRNILSVCSRDGRVLFLRPSSSS